MVTCRTDSLGAYVNSMGNVVHMSHGRPPLKIKVFLEERPDGGLRAWSDDVPGFVLSHRDADSVIGDVPVALAAILSERLDGHVSVELLVDAGSFLANPANAGSTAVDEKEYVALCA